ncbi:antibiotic biosynthesis monooxygenase [Novosphingobium sp. KCTC 2891]|uniref:putative quinol monooxygenase n=1 Tax=Novosphingobium sp. KCTC 2891 TaxID=2989730 RepID=UPI00222357F4|nr:antibiotic biosynthesis monooxygenase family protein [Novosphingobium sp. KCTC 2891]MCW1381818.1 antibiotic biosynthesis monooxygenase [Novosphingobium sp. KCTC 2891]
MDRITLWGWIDFDGKDAAAIVRGATQHIAPTYDEQGCVHYVWTADPVQTHRVWVFEEWETVADLAAHLEGPLYRAMSGYLAEAGMTGAEVNKYAVARKAPVYDGSGVPRAAFD